MCINRKRSFLYRQVLNLSRLKKAAFSLLKIINFEVSEKRTVRDKSKTVRRGCVLRARMLSKDRVTVPKAGTAPPYLLEKCEHLPRILAV